MIAKHKPLSVGCKVICRDDSKKSKPYKKYVGDNPAEWLVQELVKEGNEIKEIYTNKVSMNDLTPEMKKRYYDAIECHICKSKRFKGFAKFCDDHKCKCKQKECSVCKERQKCDGCNYYKVRNHNHITGDFIGPAHSICNINYWRLSKHTPIPVIFHNLKGYDAHHIIGSIYNVINVEVSGVIAESGEK